MNIDEIIKSIKPELLILIPAAWGLGLAAKESIVNNRLIPLILAVFCVVMACLWVIGTGGVNFALGVFSGVTQGLVCFAIEWAIYAKAIKSK